MRTRLLMGILVAMASLCVLPRAAQAQYKNTELGLDAGYWYITMPSLPTVVDQGTEKTDDGSRPNRLSNGFRLGGELNFKMDADHWWFISRVNVGFLWSPGGNISSTSLESQYDYAAYEALGTVLGIEGSIGVRYVFLTDRVRPYVQAAMSYLRLQTFKDATAAGCDGEACPTDSTTSYFLPHPNVGALHLQPGIEIIFTRDVGVNLFLDVQRWIVFNADDNNAVVAGIGLVFFT